MGWFWASVIAIGAMLVIGGAATLATVRAGMFSKRIGKLFFIGCMAFVVLLLAATFAFTELFDYEKDFIILFGIVMLLTACSIAFAFYLRKLNKEDKARIAQEQAADPSLAPTPEEQEKQQKAQSRWKKVLYGVLVIIIVYHTARILGNM